MNCSECNNLFSDYVENQLDEIILRDFETHVSSCPTCRNELDETRRLFQRLEENGGNASGRSISTAVMDRILQKQSLLLRRNRQTKQIAKFTLAAMLVVGACIGISYLISAPSGGKVYAADLLAARKQIENAKTATWKTTYYLDHFGKDKKTIKWVSTETRQYAFMAPGLWRDTTLDENGNIIYVRITDNVRLKELSLNYKTKTATLREMAFAPDGEIGSFQWVLEQEEGATEWVGTKKIGGREVNVFRNTFKSAERKFRGQVRKIAWSHDFWVDTNTKRIVRIQVPGANLYDPDKDPLLNKRPENDVRSRISAIGWAQHDIVVNTKLDASLFSLEPPEGFTLKTELRPKVTEQEMVEYIGVLAEYFENTFPYRVHPRPLTSAEINRIYDKPENERTEAEKKYLEKDRYYKMANLNLFPIKHFLIDSAVEESWKYIGKGVKLGDKSRIICWYRLKGSKTYRVVYGDLSIKDVAAEDLPLPVD